MRSRASNSARIDVRSSSSAAAESSLASCALSGFCKQAGGGKVRKRIATIQTHLAYLRLDHPVVQGGSRREKWNGELQNRTAAAYSSERASFHDEYVAGDAVTVARDKSRTVGKGGW